MRGHRWRMGLIWGLVLVGQVGTVAMAATGGILPKASAKGAVVAAEAQRTAGPVLMLHRKVVRVRIHNFAFSPAKLVVSPGTRVVWTNTDSDPHTVDSTRNVWASEALDTDGNFGRVFNKVGSFTYYCSIHPFMHGQVTVQK